MDSLLGEPSSERLIARYGREMVKDALRRGMAEGEVRPQALVIGAADSLARRFAPSLQRAINATGILLHTNLGRAPLAPSARDAVARAADGYSTLEYDPLTGERGRRQDHVRAAARDLFGCEDAIAVNNNASAVFLALSALAKGRGVLVSRGELVAIGGSFKIPEILEASGAELAEVGTTNRTSIDDYRRALCPAIAVLLTVHPSNYEIRGYTARPRAAELAELARSAAIPWVHDQGTGCVHSLEEFGVAGEPTVRDCLTEGATLVTCSTDKLFGGPQGGFALGSRDIVARLAAHPVARVVRPDKLALAALSATLELWLTGRWRQLPIYQAAAASLESLQRRGEEIASRVAGKEVRPRVEVVPSFALFGGGTSPEKRFPSRALAVSCEGLSADGLARALRAEQPPIVARVEESRVLLDLRTIDPAEDSIVRTRLAELSRHASGDRS